MDDFDLEIKKEFINEALINLDEAEGAFMELEETSDSKPLLDRIFRLAHNLKGGSRAVGFGQVAEFTHQLENLVQKIQKEDVQLVPDLVTTLLKSNDRLVEMLTLLKEDLNAQFENKDLLSEIENWMSNAPKQTAPPKIAASQPESALTIKSETELQEQILDASEQQPTTPAQDILAEGQNETEDLEVKNDPPPSAPNADAFFSSSAETSKQKNENSGQKLESPSKSSENSKKSGDDEVIRVSLSRIDLLNDYVGELIVLQSVVQQQSLSNDPKKLNYSVRQMVKLAKNIQEISMGLRMLPVKPLIQKLQRVVRDTAKTLNKEITFEIIGEQMEIDKSVLDRLSDPLIHILRNAVDHGLETTENRLKANKPKQGKVTLSFSNQGNHLLVEVRDDGRGINAEVLRKKAVEKKLIQESQELSEKQLINLIFHPGFSTKTETSEISGRGVGMDVVKTNVEKIGGTVDVSTAIGMGSQFRLQIPLSLAVFDGLIVTTETNRYAIPLSQVQETVNLQTHRIFQNKLGLGSCFELRKTVVPLFSLEEALDSRKAGSISNGTALIIQVHNSLIGLVVKDILRAQQIVIKPLSNGIVAQKGWIGSCVLGDGLPTLILSPIDLLSGRISYSNNELGESA